jgi:hypothetical protein
MNKPLNCQASSTRFSIALAADLRAVLTDVPVGADFEVTPAAEICTSLELFVPEMLRRQFSGWARESIDGFYVAKATKVGDDAAELAGTCILISDQTVTPFWVRLQWSVTRNKVASYEIRLGEPGRGTLGISGPPCNSREATDMLLRIIDRLHGVRWAFRVTGDASE